MMEFKTKCPMSSHIEMSGNIVLCLDKCSVEHYAATREVKVKWLKNAPVRNAAEDTCPKCGHATRKEHHITKNPVSMNPACRVVDFYAQVGA